MTYSFAQIMITLAEGWGGLVYILIFVVISISRYLANRKEEKEKQAESDQGHKQVASPGSGATSEISPEAPDRLQAIVRDRQQQLREIADRQLHQPQVKTGKQAESPELTSRKTVESRTQSKPPVKPLAAPIALSKIEREALPSQTKRESTQQRTQPQTENARGLPSQSARPQRLPKPSQPKPARQQANRQTEGHGLNVKLPGIHQVTQDQTRPAASSKMKIKLDRQSLRQAIILKEVLDKPVALRDTQASYLNW